MVVFSNGRVGEHVWYVSENSGFMGPPVEECVHLHTHTSFPDPSLARYYLNELCNLCYLLRIKADCN